jgi:hypothetical protein
MIIIFPVGEVYYVKSRDPVTGAILSKNHITQPIAFETILKLPDLLGFRLKVERKTA